VGDVHELIAAPSSEHVNVDPDSVELNENDADVLVPLDGAAVIVVSGGVLSGGGLIVQVAVAGVASVLPAASVAATVKVWLPVVRPL
jgi:hypothetical protein